jgi:hypothetical protein
LKNKIVFLGMVLCACCFAGETMDAGSKTELSQIVGKIGLGLGVPYGVLGVNAEIGTQYISLVGGMGTAMVVSDPGWGIGARAYFLNASHKWRPNITVVYGTTTMYLITGDVEASGVLTGVGTYFSVDHDVGKRNGFVFTYGLGFITHGEIPQDVKDKVSAMGNTLPSFGSPLKVMVGFNYRFGGVKQI